MAGKAKEKPVVEVVETPVVEVSDNSIVKFESNGSGKHMKESGKIYEIPASMAQRFVVKKLGKIVQ